MSIPDETEVIEVLTQRLLEVINSEADSTDLAKMLSLLNVVTRIVSLNHASRIIEGSTNSSFMAFANHIGGTMAVVLPVLMAAYDSVDEDVKFLLSKKTNIN